VLRWNPDGIIRDFVSDEATRSVIEQQVFKHPDWLDMDRGVLAEDKAIDRFRERTGLSVAELSALMQAVKESLQPIPGAVELLEDLAARHVPLYCLSNMPATTSDYLRARYSFWRLFKGIVISGEIRLLKPDPAIFEHIVARFSLNPRNTAFVDDNLPNIESARKLGFKTIVFSDPAQCRADLQVLLGELF
jgi:putative hydrolase of the HAD superfamily